MSIGTIPRSVFMLLFCVSCNFHATAQISYLKDPLHGKDTTKFLFDTIPLKVSHLKSAGNVLKDVIFSSPGDFVQMGNILTKDWKKTTAYVGGVAIIVFADKPITQWYQDKVEKHINYQLPNLPGSNKNMFFRGNDAYLNFSILGLYGGSLIGNYKTGQRAALNSVKALTYSYLITHVILKAGFARQRPDPELSDGKPPRAPYTENSHDFFQFRSINFRTGALGTSFPSLHATAYYSVAKVMAMEFHNYWVPYGAVTFLFFADLDSHRHWVGDMVAGGLLGTLIGQAIVKSSNRRDDRTQKNNLGLHPKRKIDFNYQIIPAVSSDMVGLTLLVSL